MISSVFLVANFSAFHVAKNCVFLIAKNSALLFASYSLLGGATFTVIGIVFLLQGDLQGFYIMGMGIPMLAGAKYFIDKTSGAEDFKIKKRHWAIHVK